MREKNKPYPEQFRLQIGHLGDSNDLTLIATIAACEMGMKLAGMKLAGSCVHAAMDYFSAN